MGLGRLNILSFGAGAIGTYVGGSLALAGNRLVFLEQAEVAAQLRQRGLRLDLSLDRRRAGAGVATVPPEAFVCAGSPAEALEHGPFDVALFAMKSYDTAAALEQVMPFAARMPPVLCLQNGVDNEPAIAAVLGADKVIPGTVTGSIGRRAAGDVVLEKARGMGIAAGHPLAGRLVAALNDAGLHARLYPRAADMKWSKVLMNLPGGPLSAIVDLTIAQVFGVPGLFGLEKRASLEALAVMAAQGVRPVDLPGTPVRLLAAAWRWPGFLVRPLMARAIGGGRGGKMPSYHIDLHAGRKQSEVAWLQGAVVRYGSKYGVPTPVNRVLTDTLLAMVRGEIPIAEYSHQPEKLIALVAREAGH
ncbi:MAG TPA: 2-dehydropantoate 2-reductase [Streptosporangiaceae bacterium]|nr:2-dehydropantoate 2-reductase [Streptosporangiaceae bacterium]